MPETHTIDTTSENFKMVAILKHYGGREDFIFPAVAYQSPGALKIVLIADPTQVGADTFLCGRSIERQT